MSIGIVVVVQEGRRGRPAESGETVGGLDIVTSLCGCHWGDAGQRFRCYALIHRPRKRAETETSGKAGGDNKTKKKASHSPGVRAGGGRSGNKKNEGSEGGGGGGNGRGAARGQELVEGARKLRPHRVGN